MEKLTDKWKPQRKIKNKKESKKESKLNGSYYYAHGTGPHTENMLAVMKAAFFA